MGFLLGAIAVAVVVVVALKLLPAPSRFITKIGIAWLVTAFILQKALNLYASLIGAKKGGDRSGALADEAVYLAIFGYGGGIAIIGIGLAVAVLYWLSHALFKPAKGITQSSMLEVLEQQDQATPEKK